MTNECIFCEEEFTAENPCWNDAGTYYNDADEVIGHIDGECRNCFIQRNPWAYSLANPARREPVAVDDAVDDDLPERCRSCGSEDFNPYCEECRTYRRA